MVSNYNWLTPNHGVTLVERMRRLGRIRSNPGILPGLKDYYRENPAQFITDWGMTYDPMRLDTGGLAKIPFILFPRQEAWVQWVMQHWTLKTPGLTEKSRESGVSWLAISLSVTLCLLNPGITIGFGSRKQEYVDVIGNLKSLFEKARFFIENLPKEFTGGWSRNKHSKLCLITFPNGSSIEGEAGDNIGRGARASIYFVDEAAFIERSHLIEASLSQTTQCRIDISTPNGLANAFAEKRQSGRIDVFTFHWMQDPRKDQAWYEKQMALLDPVTIAQEINIDYAASTEGVLIPQVWVQAAIDAHVKLGIDCTGIKRAGMDIADEGKDLNALCLRHGILLDKMFEWSGKGGDIADSVTRACGYCDCDGYRNIIYDSDGLGAGVRGDGRLINEQRIGDNKIKFVAFRGSEKVIHPTSIVKGTTRTNEDYFANRKAQSWWDLRRRFQMTFRAVSGDTDVDLDSIISINSNIPLINKLTRELSQPTYKINSAGKIIVDKTPDGVKSPNLADSIMISFSSNSEPIFTNNMAEAVRKLF